MEHSSLVSCFSTALVVNMVTWNTLFASTASILPEIIIKVEPSE